MHTFYTKQSSNDLIVLISEEIANEDQAKIQRQYYFITVRSRKDAAVSQIKKIIVVGIRSSLTRFPSKRKKHETKTTDLRKVSNTDLRIKGRNKTCVQFTKVNNDNRFVVVGSITLRVKVQLLLKIFKSLPCNEINTYLLPK